MVNKPLPEDEQARLWILRLEAQRKTIGYEDKLRKWVWRNARSGVPVKRGVVLPDDFGVEASLVAAAWEKHHIQQARVDEFLNANQFIVERSPFAILTVFDVASEAGRPQLVAVDGVRLPEACRDFRTSWRVRMTPAELQELVGKAEFDASVMQCDRVYSVKDEYRRMLWCSKNMQHFVEMPVREMKGLVASQIWRKAGTGQQIEENDQRAMDKDRPMLFRELITCRRGTLERLAIRYPMRMQRIPRAYLGVFACGYPRLQFVS